MYDRTFSGRSSLPRLFGHSCRDDCVVSVLGSWPVKRWYHTTVNSMLNKYSEAVRGNLNRNQRSKVVALVTIEVHARDVIDKMIKTNTNDVTAFEWLQQLRLYWDKVSLLPFFYCLSCVGFLSTRIRYFSCMFSSLRTLTTALFDKPTPSSSTVMNTLVTLAD